MKPNIRGLQWLFASAALISCASPIAEEAPAVAVIRVVDRQGQPMSDARVFIAVKTEAYAPIRLVDGKLSKDGTFQIPRPDAETDVRQFIVNIGSRTAEIGRFNPDHATISPPIEFVMPPVEGDPAPDIALEELSSDEHTMLSEYRGQVVLLDFWASWCEPCQEPMAHNQEIVSRRSDWEDKAAIIALSIDDTKQAAIDHIERKGWTSIQHFWSAEGEETGWKSLAPREYGITAIPTALLIGADGVIQWVGNPRHVNPEELIDRALSR